MGEVLPGQGDARMSGFPTRDDLPDDLVKMLGNPRKFDEIDKKILDDLSIALENYNVIREEEDVRPKDVLNDIKNIDITALKLVDMIEALREKLDDLPMSAEHPEVSPEWYYKSAAGLRADFSSDLRKFAKSMQALHAEIDRDLGRDCGGRAGIRTHHLGNPKFQLAWSLAPIWSHFKGPPKGTIGGEFYLFVCAAHRSASGVEASNFEREAKVVARKFTKQLKLASDAEKRIEELRHLIMLVEAQADEAHRRGKAEMAAALARRALYVEERRRRLVWWRAHRCFV
jgi:hypothetical protein